MRYVILHSNPESVGDPPQALLDAIARLLAKYHMLQGIQLHESAQGAVVRVSRGKVVVTDGPFAEAKEVLGGLSVYEFPSKEEALAGVREFMGLFAEHWPGYEGACEVRAIMEGPLTTP